jgi:hypothetical protein
MRLCSASPKSRKTRRTCTGALSGPLPRRYNFFAARFFRHGTTRHLQRSYGDTPLNWEHVMGFGKGALLWLLGIPLPIIILLALFWR